MSEALLLDEHYPDLVAAELRAAGHDVEAVVADPDLRARPDAEVYRWAAARDRRIVTENIKDFRPLLLQAYVDSGPVARLLLVPSRRFPRAGGARTTALTNALSSWLASSEGAHRPDEDWLV